MDYAELANAAIGEKKHFDEWKTSADILGFGNPSKGVHLSFAEFQKIGAMLDERDRTIAALRQEPPAPGKSVLETIDEYRREHPGAIERAEAELEAEGAFADLPPALPAEVEAVLMQMKIASGRLYGKTVDVIEDAATMLRRYAQAVAEKDADRKNFRARVFLASSGGSFHSTGCTIWGDDGQGHTEEGFTQPLPCNCGALINFRKKEVATLQSEAREKDAEIARLTGIEKRAKSYRALLTPGSYCEISECQVFDDMTAILLEEH